MKVVIAGCGRVGSTLATKLSREGHAVSVVDKDPTSFERLGKTFKGTTVRGFVFDGEALRKAGIEKADAFASVTSGDNSNIVSATIAKDIYRVPKVVARIYDPRRAEIYRRLGIATVSSVSWASNEILTLMLHTEVTRDVTLGDGEVQITRLDIPHRLVGRAVDEINVAGEIVIISITRGGKAFIPSSGAILQENDMLEVAVLTTAMPTLRRMVAP